MDGLSWYCVRQQAGALTKECRALRPRFKQEEAQLDRRAKAALKRCQKTAVNRHPVDRLEIRLALLGPGATHYTLTYDSAHLPRDFPEVRRCIRNFLVRVHRYRGGRSLDWIYAIEGLHGDHRYHVHFVCPGEQLSPVEVAFLWRQGGVEDEPVLRVHRYQDPETGRWVSVSEGGYRRLAEYLNKERTDGVVIPIGRHPWSCSRSLSAKVAPPRVWMDSTNAIEIPSCALWSRRGSVENDFGAYYYGSWIKGPY